MNNQQPQYQPLANQQQPGLYPGFDQPFNPQNQQPQQFNPNFQPQQQYLPPQQFNQPQIQNQNPPQQIPGQPIAINIAVQQKSPEVLKIERKIDSTEIYSLVTLCWLICSWSTFFFSWNMFNNIGSWMEFFGSSLFGIGGSIFAFRAKRRYCFKQLGTAHTFALICLFYSILMLLLVATGTVEGYVNYENFEDYVYYFNPYSLIFMTGFSALAWLVILPKMRHLIDDREELLGRPRKYIKCCGGRTQC